jgi:hypothetical protein
MPVSKKRKKEGKPVHRAVPPTPEGEHPHGPDAREGHQKSRSGKPGNPFVAQQQPRRAAQRGR